MFWSALSTVLLKALATGVAGAAAGITSACRSLEASLLEKYLRSEREEGTIHEHVSTLRLYASRVRHVTEAGVQFGTSSWALLQGLHDTSVEGDQKVHLAYDINPFPQADQARAIGECLGIKYQFHLQDFNSVKIEETDLLFIDTLHVYAQLRNELRAHAPSVRRYIIMHDTTVDGDVSECVRMSDRRDCNNLARSLGVKVQEVRVGLWPAIQEFLSGNSDWYLTHRYTHNNGLTILARRPPMSEWAPPSLLIPGPSVNEVQAKVEQLRQELQKLPSSWVHAQLGVLHMMFTRHRRLGWDHVEAALAVHPFQLHAQLMLASSLCPHWARFRCDSPLALERFSQIVEKHNISEAHLAYGAVLVAHGRTAEAVLSLRMALAMRPQSRHVLDIVGRALRRIGGTEEANAIFDDAVRSGLWASPVQRPTVFFCPPGVSSVTLIKQDIPVKLAAVRREVLQSWMELRTEAMNASRSVLQKWTWEQDLKHGRCHLERVLLLYNEAVQDVQRAVSLPKTCALMDEIRRTLQVRFVRAQLSVLKHRAAGPPWEATLESLSELQGQHRLLCTVSLPQGVSLWARVPGGSEKDLRLQEGDCHWLDASVEHWLLLQQPTPSPSSTHDALTFSLDVADFSHGSTCEFEPAPFSAPYWHAALRRADV